MYIDAWRWREGGRPPKGNLRTKDRPGKGEPRRQKT